MYKAVLFDLDGTLTESGEGIMKSVQYALEKIGKPEPETDRLRVFVGPPLLQQFMSYAGLDEETAQKAVKYYRERYSVVGIFENRPYPGIGSLLEMLRERGYLLAVASSKPECFVLQILDHFHLREYFDVAVGSELDGRRTRKSEVIEETLRRLGFLDRRDQVLMVGDKEHDVLGAREAGIACVAVLYGYGSREELEGADPLRIVDSVEDLTRFFA